MDNRRGKANIIFCGLESWNYCNKLIPKIKKTNGEVIDDQFEILKQVESYYTKFFSSKNTNLDNNIDLNTYLNFDDIKILNN